ncbi:lysophospholipid acyltransferase family protein [Porticoccaceae bacterium]|nr:lysophospholipid acyltransferase family protein [Porticoccaceae bacterium]MDB9999340.1 lysophospholipid acyltransferase family protein [Porticoccaceae bacterium]MDC0004119.1 lysophospholipid acyltransferase family protein [Porticoccaceae bacterium]
MRYTLFTTPILSPILRVISRIILKIIRWRVVGSIPTDQRKYVLIVAPHTSNWDFVLFVLAVSVLRLKPSVLIKSTLFIGPLGWFLRYCGAIPVNRSQANSLVSYIASIYQEHEDFVLIVTPEGTRSPNANWKRGFHHVATAAQVPILIVYVDSVIKTIGIEGVMEPTDDIEGDIIKLKKFFDTKSGLKPKNYAS